MAVAPRAGLKDRETMQPTGSGQPNVTKPDSAGFGCRKVVGMSCMMLMLIGFTCTMILGDLVEKQISSNRRSPNTMFGQLMNMSASGVRGQAIVHALVHYHAREGVYPKNLISLVPEMIPDARLLHNDLDTDSDPDHISWTYSQPAPTVSPGTVVLRDDYQIPYPGGDKNHGPIPYELSLTLDGGVDNEPLTSPLKK